MSFWMFKFSFRCEIQAGWKIVGTLSKPKKDISFLYALDSFLSLGYHNYSNSAYCYNAFYI